MARVHRIQSSEQMQELVRQGTISFDDIVIYDSPEAGTPQQVYQWGSHEGKGMWIPLDNNQLSALMASGAYTGNVGVGEGDPNNALGEVDETNPFASFQGDAGAGGGFTEYPGGRTLADALEDMEGTQSWYQEQSINPINRQNLWLGAMQAMGPRVSYPYRQFLESQYNPLAAQYVWEESPYSMGGTAFGDKDPGNWGFRSYLDTTPDVWSRQQWMDRLSPMAGHDLENITEGSVLDNWLASVTRADEENIIRQATMAGVAPTVRSGLDRALTSRFQSQFLQDPQQAPGELFRQYASGGFSRNPFQAYA